MLQPSKKKTTLQLQLNNRWDQELSFATFAGENLEQKVLISILRVVLKNGITNSSTSPQMREESVLRLQKRFKNFKTSRLVGVKVKHMTRAKWSHITKTLSLNSMTKYSSHARIVVEHFYQIDSKSTWKVAKNKLILIRLTNWIKWIMQAHYLTYHKVVVVLSQAPNSQP